MPGLAKVKPFVVKVIPFKYNNYNFRNGMCWMNGRTGFDGSVGLRLFRP